MAKRHDVTETAAGCSRRRHGLVRGLLLLFAILSVVLAGCQETSSSVQGPSTAAEPAKIAAPANENSGQEAQAEETPVAEGPRIAFDTLVHDFGEIGPGTAQTASFPFKNVGDEPLKIIHVRSCCGVVTRGVKAGQVYQPGESGSLDLDYTASLQAGSMKRSLYIQSNDPVLSVATLTIQATIVPRVEYTPARLRLFLNQENAGAKDITLTSLDGKPFSIKGFRSTANAIKADFDPSKEATRFVLEPKVNPAKLEQNPRGQISIDLTHPECKNVRLLYDVLPEFTVNPQQIMLFNLKADQPVQREIWILSNYQKDFEIESVTSQKGFATLIEEEKVDDRYRLKVEITPPAAESDRAVMSDVIEIKIKDGQTLSIQCRGFY